MPTSRQMDEALALATFHQELETGYHIAREIALYCHAKGITLGISNGMLTFERQKVEPDLEALLSEHKEHLKLFFMNGGQPPPGVVMLGAIDKQATAEIRPQRFTVRDTKSI